MSTFLCLFAAITMMVSPMMACCLTGHVDQAEATTQVAGQYAVQTAPACHDTGKAKPSGDSDPQKYCPSCDDCVVAPTDNAGMDTVIVVQIDTDTLSLAALQRAVPRAELQPRRTTGPPPLRQTPPIDSALSPTDSLII